MDPSADGMVSREELMMLEPEDVPTVQELEERGETAIGSGGSVGGQEGEAVLSWLRQAAVPAHARVGAANGKGVTATETA
eukprot:ctg_1183.g382